VLRVSTSTLERWEKLGIGPKPVRLETGRVRYPWPEVRKAAQGKAA
jgi:predicted site-specific integrase-resolvase